MLASFVIIFYAINWQFKLYAMFPAVLECDQYEDQYGTLLEYFAVQEYKLNELRQQAGGMVKYSGLLQCFCNEQAMLGVPSDKSYSAENLEICYNFESLGWLRFLGDQGVSIAIVILNMILTKICVVLVQWIGYESYSKVFSKLSSIIFIVTFFNTALVILLADANFDEFYPNGLFKGQFNDYSQRWYLDVGSILVVSMIINIFVPVIEIAAETAISFYMRRSDQSWIKEPEKARFSTKCENWMQFYDKHSGPEFEVHVKYAELMNVIYVCLWYGPQMPILYVIGVIHYFVFWNVTRYAIVYTYRLPPSMDFSLTQTNLMLLKLVPVVYLANAYWICSNKQIFQGWVNERISTDFQMSSGHNFISTLTLNQSAPILFMFICQVAIMIATSLCPRKLERLGFSSKEYNILID